MYFRQLLNDETACASYLLGCKSRSSSRSSIPTSTSSTSTSRSRRRQGIPIVAVFETHLQADHVSGLPELVARTGATAYLPEGAGVDFEHHALADGEVVKLGNTELEAIATPGHAAAHHSYLVTDRTRSDEPWMVLSGDALLVGDAGRPDLHAHGDQTVEEMAGVLYRSLTERLLALPDHLALYPAHYSGSVCGRGLSGEPGLDDRLRAPPQPGAPVRLRAGLRRGADQGHPAGARAAGRDHRRQPDRAPARRGALGVSAIRLGLRENLAQFSLLVAVNALVGAMVGLERSTLPLIGQDEFGVASSAAVLVVHRRVRAREVVHEPRRRGAGGAGRPTPAAAARLGGGAAGPAA